ncbi:MAG: deoxyguanosinetriphosphate triphosphohydrolase [Thermomicrobiales bacterium]|nr:deoxyguanosinetriphosphate triphosphohydrolase [Thermomicrobiales bacterium]
MTIREQLEHLEDETLAPRATRSAGAVRQHPDEPSEMRTEFQRDRDRIIHTKSFRRLMHKTQVFIAPQGDHYRTRLTHTLEVTQIARTIGRALRLNEDLIEAIGMGHDLGHTPFGHAGERALAEVFPGFRHNEQSLRVVEYLENDGRGLNLTDPVRNGILRHSKGRASIMASHALDPETLEGEVLKLSDGIAYMNHDLDDAIRAGILDDSDVPARVQKVLGTRHSQRINTLVADVIAHSDVISPDGHITMSSEVREAADVLRDFLYKRVYEPINALEETKHKQEIVNALFFWFGEFPEGMPDQYLANLHREPLERRVADYVASMTDRFAIDIWDSLFGDIDEEMIAAMEEEESGWIDD